MFNWFCKDAELTRVYDLLEKSSRRERDLILRLDSIMGQLYYREKELIDLKSKESDQLRKDNGLSLLEGAITWGNIKKSNNKTSSIAQEIFQKGVEAFPIVDEENKRGFRDGIYKGKMPAPVPVPLPKKPGRKPKVKAE
jgi:hypothetical protein